MDEIQIDFLTRKLISVNFCSVEKSNDYSMYHINKDSATGDKNVSMRESEAILVIKLLQEQVYVNIYFLLTL
jgi:activator of HSP90 ATPase